LDNFKFFLTNQLENSTEERDLVRESFQHCKSAQQHKLQPLIHQIIHHLQTFFSFINCFFVVCLQNILIVAGQQAKNKKFMKP
jgi:hypothetical protein